MKLSKKEIMLLARIANSKENGYTRDIREVTRKSDREFDLHVEGMQYDARTNEMRCMYGMWLPLGAIGALIDWGKPEVVRMCDFGSLDAGWSAIRDSNKTTIWRIFEKFVIGE